MLTPPSVAAQALRVGDSTCELSIHAALRIGTAYPEFGSVAAVAFVGDTTLAVADGRASRVLFFDTRGRHLATYGREGEGPGEFRLLQRLSSRGDTAVAYDASARRMTLFTAAGGYVRSAPAPRSLTGLLDDGTIVSAATGGGTRRGSAGPEVWPDTLEIHIHRAEGEPRTVARVQDRTRIADFRTSLSFVDVPYTAAPHVVVSGGTIYVSDGSEVIQRFRADGSPLTPLRSPFERRPVTQQDRARWAEDRLARTDRRYHPVTRGLFEIAPRVSQTPAHGRIAVDRQSRWLWVQEYRAPFDETPRRLAALDASGRRVLGAVLPASQSLAAVSTGHAAFTDRDELDVQTVVVYPIECSGS